MHLAIAPLLCILLPKDGYFAISDTSLGLSIHILADPNPNLFSPYTALASVGEMCDQWNIHNYGTKSMYESAAKALCTLQ